MRDGEYAYALLKEFDNYGSEDLDVCAREVVAQIHELQSQVTELQTRSSELVNEVRMWKARTMASRKIVESVMLLWESRLGADEDQALTLFRQVAERADQLERDAWCKAASIARSFVVAVERPMLGYVPDAVRPIDGDDPKSTFIRYWAGRFKAGLGE